MDKAVTFVDVVADTATTVQAAGTWMVVGGLAVWIGGFLIGAAFSFIRETREESK